MEERLEDRVFVCSSCGKEHEEWDGACDKCGFKRSIRMSQAVVKRLKPFPFKMGGPRERADISA